MPAYQSERKKQILSAAHEVPLINRAVELHKIADNRSLALIQASVLAELKASDEMHANDVIREGEIWPRLHERIGTISLRCRVDSRAENEESVRFMGALVDSLIEAGHDASGTVRKNPDFWQTDQIATNRAAGSLFVTTVALADGLKESRNPSDTRCYETCLRSWPSFRSPEVRFVLATTSRDKVELFHARLAAIGMKNAIAVPDPLVHAKWLRECTRHMKEFAAKNGIKISNVKRGGVHVLFD